MLAAIPRATPRAIPRAIPRAHPGRLSEAIRALVDLMRIPSALQLFEVELLTVDPRLPPGRVQVLCWLLQLEAELKQMEHDRNI